MPVHSETRDGVTVLTLDRPSRRNALDMQMWRDLRQAALAVEDVRVVIVTGRGDHFCAGMDLNPDNPLFAEAAPAIADGDETAARHVILELKSCVQALADLPCPTIAAIEGACIGGGLEVALACDMRFAAANASLGLLEVRIGMIPDLGGCARLTRLVGPGRAADLICTARRIDGDDALRLGVVERVASPGTALATARAAAAEIVANGPMAVRLALNAVRVGADLGLAEALAIETRAGVMALTSGEPREGVTAFLEKRAPRWDS
ncbi:MAG: enoyl-CoA hydratase/isomerase family protein [Pseudomonadota bacterium]|nr:enoyl-CoA hydratase/isomerase family protein [Pseudomonadota bacterium]